MEEVQLHQEPADLWMECEEGEEEKEEVEDQQQEQQLRFISMHTGPAEELSFSQSSSVKVTSVT